MRRYLLPDFRHDEIDQPVGRGNAGMARRGSALGEESAKAFANRNADV